MNDEVNYQNNPLHGVGLKALLTELVDQYGYEILFAYLNINCFKTKPSIESSVKFLKKTDWAREKVEAFYLYQLKNLPRASNEQFELSPRDRIVPPEQQPGEPAELSLEDAEQLKEKREQKAAEHDRGEHSSQRNQRQERSGGHQSKPKRRPTKSDDNSSSSNGSDPWSQWR
jgi:uncharacterized protein (DUF2132 family)